MADQAIQSADGSGRFEYQRRATRDDLIMKKKLVETDTVGATCAAKLEVAGVASQKALRETGGARK